MKKESFQLKKMWIGILILLLALPLTGRLHSNPEIARAETNTGLKENTESSKEVEAFGISSEQPNKETPAGEEVVKTKNNPLGPSVVSMNRISGLAVSGITSADNGMCTLYKTPFTTSFLNVSSSNIVTPLRLDKLLSSTKGLTQYQAYKNVKAMTSADLNGDGKQEVVTALLIPGTTKTDVGKVYLGIMVRSYTVDSNKNATDYTDAQVIISGAFTPPASTNLANLEYPMDIVSGDFDQDNKDELSVVVGTTLYTCELNSSGVVYKVSEYTFTMPTSPKYGDRISIASADADKDGFKELLVSTGSSRDIYGENNPALLVYDNTNTLYTRWNAIPLNFTVNKEKVYFINPSFDVGDVLGDGSERIVIGGKCSDGKIYLATSLYNAEKKSYDSLDKSSDTSSDERYFEVGVKGVTKSNMWGIISKEMGLKCVALTTRKPGDPEYVELGGTLFKYDPDQRKFAKLSINQVYNDSYSKNSTNSDGITNITADGDGIGGDDAAYILDTMVGNFDGNKEGKEQIVMLHCNIIGGTNAEVYITWCGADQDGNLITHLKRIWYPKMGPYTNVSICDVDVFNNAITMTYLPEKSEFTFTTPSVIAVIGASPFYQEISDRSASYSSILGNSSTTFGKEAESSKSKSKGVDIHAGVSFGYSQEQDLLGLITLDEVTFTTELTASFTNTWTDSLSITKGITYINNLGDDAMDTVVIMTTPYDIYHYQVTGPDGKVTEMTINVPYEPLSQQISVEEYNCIVQTKKMQNAPIITDEVLNHTVGDPRTYPQDMRDIKGAQGYLTGNDFVSVGRGTANMAEQSITVTKGSEYSFDYNLDITVSMEINIAGATAGASFGAGYVDSKVTSNSESTLSTGSVLGLPVEYMNKNYGFKWKLALYNYDLKLYGSDQTQRCYVVSYLVKPIGSKLPPHIPENLKATSKTDSSVYLTWDVVKDGAGYIISRSVEKDGTYTEIGKNPSSNENSYMDEKGVKTGVTYYYKVRAYSSVEGIDCEPVKGNALYVRAISTNTTPRLSYMPGDIMELSELSVKLTYSDSSEKIIYYKDFAKYNLSAGLENGAVLTAFDNERKLTVTYDVEGSSTKTVITAGKLTVYDVKSIEITSPPRLFYTEGELLDLSKLSVTLIYSNNTRKAVGLNEFANNKLTISRKNGELINLADNNTDITITYQADGMSEPIIVTMDKLVVYKEGDNDVLLTADFSVAGVANAFALQPNQELKAEITATNNQEAKQTTLVMLALYDDAGSMVGIVCGTIDLEARSTGKGFTKKLTLTYTLPAGTNNNYQVKVFAWEGTDLNSTSQIPISNIIQMP